MATDDAERQRREQVRRLRAYHAECARRHAEWRERGYQYPPPAHVPMPDDLARMACGARTRAGTPCKQRGIFANGRCKLHGGMSTGPTTAEGRERCRQAALRRWAKVRDGTL